MDTPVVDEYYEQYRRLSHAELYRQLRAGSPAEVDALATAWRTVEAALLALASSLRHDLDALRLTWIGDGGSEYQHRLGLVATWAEVLGREAVEIRTGLSLMSSMLADAQRRAEPDAADPTEWTLDGILGPALGHTLTAAERTRSHDRLARLVAELAAGYGIAEHQSWPATLPDAPPGLPGDLGAGPDRITTQLAAAPVAAATPPSGPPPVVAHTAATPAVPATPAPAVPAPAASTLTGAGSGLAAATATGHLVGQPLHRTGVEGEPPAGQAPISSMLGGGLVAGPPTTTVPGHHRPYDEETSWSAGEDSVWAGGTDDPPPAVIGDPARPA